MDKVSIKKSKTGFSLKFQTGPNSSSVVEITPIQAERLHRELTKRLRVQPQPLLKVAKQLAQIHKDDLSKAERNIARILLDEGYLRPDGDIYRTRPQ